MSSLQNFEHAEAATGTNTLIQGLGDLWEPTNVLEAPRAGDSSYIASTTLGGWPGIRAPGYLAHRTHALLYHQSAAKEEPAFPLTTSQDAPKVSKDVLR